MSVVAFWLLALMLTIYVILDGYDLGVASITPLVARDEDERAAAMQSIGPFWNGNEVWLIATGAVLFALFPKAYASAFSGFYLPFMIVLWLLMIRGIALELRSHFPSRMWHEFWDTCFCAASVLLIVLFGVALGNLLRGVPLDASGYFQGTFGLLLNPYALSVAALALVTLAMHGAAFLVLRLDGPPAERARVALPWLWRMSAVVYVLVTAFTLWTSRETQPRPLVTALIALAILALVAARIGIARGAEWPAFLATSTFIATLLVAAAAKSFPYLLPAYPVSTAGLSIFSAAPPPVSVAT
ncbi:MAG: cytochrome d ubiquinol oxidase subunit II, partial [Candidatus Eremiobacteraeota bacterium]|nr:cytochrome d ubiquinol oxidase subunit II [Candidatus Eremiobacteraeota bacterium]